MDDTQGPVRGLEQVARFYLSDNQEDRAGLEQHHPSIDTLRTVFVCAPGSPKMRTFLLANLCLELARNRHPVIIRDHPGDSEPSLEQMMKALPTRHTPEGLLKVCLYGLPDILIKAGDSGGQRLPSRGEEPSAGIPGTGSEWFSLVGLSGSIEQLKGMGQGSKVTLMSRDDPISLLRCYACIHVLATSVPDLCVSLILHGVCDPPTALRRSHLFSEIVSRKCGVRPRYLGSFGPDAWLEHSINEGKPLVLFHEASPAREQMITIAEQFLLWFREDHPEARVP
ncbi:MAG: hypothetical protein RRA35_02045 [Desulfomonilia bacterium]|nr:hypothetical protein [Desulfomonilia bacterium]